MLRGQMLIAGQLTESESGRWLDSINPATEEVIGAIPQGSARDVDRAVAAAERAFPDWSKLDVDDRAEYLLKLSDRISSRAEEIARTEVMDTGHTIARVRNDVRESAWFSRFCAGLGYELKGNTIPSTAGNYHFTIREPYGVVGRIVPFNHPVMFAARIAAPLIAGNTVILKPPKEASLSVCLFGEICREVMPPGVVNIVTGSGEEVGEALGRHPGVRRIGFIGSRATGLKLQKAASESVVKFVTLELGGKNPMVVFPDANVEEALASVVRGMSFAWSGQSCGSLSRLFLHSSIYESSIQRLRDIIGSLRVGDPSDENTDMGPVIHKAQYEKVLYYIKTGIEEGARLVTGGVRPEGERFRKGYWIRPTVFADVTPDMRIFKEEIFGPVLSVIRWDNVEEVIQMANAVEYGLTASIWTEDLRSALETVRRIKAGYCWINTVSTHFKAVPFGGMKNSGVGREECLEEILSYTECKSINIALN